MNQTGTAMRNSLSERRKWITEKHEWDIEDQEGTAMKTKELELLAEKVHKIYCEQYEKDHGKPYWTNGDYSKLEERVKEYDRAIVRFMQQYANKVSREVAVDFELRHVYKGASKSAKKLAYQYFDEWKSKQEQQ